MRRIIAGALVAMLLAGPAWAADSTILIPTGELLDTEQLTVAGQSVRRQRIEIGGTTASGIAAVLNSAPGGAEYGLVGRIAGTVTVAPSANFSNSFPTPGYAVGFKDTGNNMAPGLLDASGFLKVNIAAGGAAGGTSSTFGAAYPAAGTAMGFKDSAGTAMQAGNLDASGNLKIAIATPTTFASTQSGTWNVGLSTGSNVIGAVTQSGTWTMQPGNTANTTPWLVKPHDGSAALFSSAAAMADGVANPTLGGIAAFLYGFNGTTWDRAKAGVTDTDDGSVAAAQASVSLIMNLPYAYNGSAYVRLNPLPYMLTSAATTNSTNVKASRGLITGVSVTNINAAARYLLVFDSASAPTCTNAPAYKLLIPPSSSGHSPNLFQVPVPFANGIGFCITTAQDGTGSVAVNELIVNMTYQ